VYPSPEVIRFVTEHLVPVKIHVKEQPATFERFEVQWTPTLVILNNGGTERHRWEGFLPADDFLAELELGLAKIAFAQKRFSEAAGRFRAVAEQHPKSVVAPTAVYWAGVARYKDSGNAGELKEAAQALQSRYPESEWATKASVWLS
jgi:Tetratricopeptide repeat